MGTRWLSQRELASWVRLVAVMELLPGVLDAELRREAELTHYDYYVLAVLSEAPQRTLRMSELARLTNATLPRLSHVVSRLESRGFIERLACPKDGRATNARLTEEGWTKLRRTAPGHVETVRQYVTDALTPEQIDQLRDISEALLERLDPEGRLAPTYRRHDEV